MVEEKLTLEPEVITIFDHIENGHNFLLSGGAGSGKTYSLVQVIRECIRRHPTAIIACMTFTNAAVKEIEERVRHKNLKVTTIHDFLWDCIKSFKKELRKTLVLLLNDETVTSLSVNEEKVPSDYFDHLPNGIQYKEWVILRDGIISHDELIILAEKMFSSYPMLSHIIKDKYKFIFIDEYQDTNELVVKIFLDHLKLSNKSNTVGFFGDAMQSIYDDGIGNLNGYKGTGDREVREVKKSQNRRSPQRVIELANKLRTDGIVQVHSTDIDAPNMINGEVKEGSIKFLYSEDGDISKVKTFITEKFGWNFDNQEETKELNLTHNLIAEKAGFRSLMDIYDKDYILDYKKRIKDYIKKKGIETDFSEMTFGDVILNLSQGKAGKELSAVMPTSSMQQFIDKNLELYEAALSYNYPLFSKFYVEKDQLIDDKKQNEDDDQKKGSKRDHLIRHLFKIQTTISLYQSKEFNEFLKATDYRFSIRSIEDKKKLKGSIEKLISVGDKTVEEIINQANESGITLIDDRLLNFKVKNEYLYNRVKEIQFSEFQRLFDYLQGKTPFSTQHKTKGREFDNVFVILDNGGWNKYNFEYLFLNAGTASVLERSQKIFYVCCTRAKENLAVYFHHPSEATINKAKEWFGTENVYSVPN